MKYPKLAPMKKKVLTQKMMPLVYFNSVGLRAGRTNFQISQKIKGAETIKPPTMAMVMLDMNVPLTELTCKFNFIGGIQSESPMPNK